MRQDKLYPDVTWHSYELPITFLSGTNTRKITLKDCSPFTLKLNFYLEKKPGILIQNAGGPVFISCLWVKQKLGYSGPYLAWFKFLHYRTAFKLGGWGYFPHESICCQFSNLCFEYCSYSCRKREILRHNSCKYISRPDLI